MPNYLRETRRQAHNVRVDVRVQRAFGRRLRTSRAEHGYSRKQLARETKCSWLFLACCEHGLAAPRLLTLVSLAHALGTDSGDLVQGLGQDYEFRDE
jgi:ribosome-binding protein aMBF1 (putative translation factor)